MVCAAVSSLNTTMYSLVTFGADLTVRVLADEGTDRVKAAAVRQVKAISFCICIPLITQNKMTTYEFHWYVYKWLNVCIGNFIDHLVWNFRKNF